MTDDEMLNELLDLDEGLSNWEVGFIDNLFQQRKTFGHLTLSDLQGRKLKAIWERMCDK